MTRTLPILFTATATLLATAATAVGAANRDAASVTRAGFSGSVCALLTAKQVSSVGVSPPKCTANPPVKSRVAATYIAYWGSSTAAPKHLIVFINRGTPAIINVMKQKMQDKSGWVGTPSKVPGLGSFALQATSADIGEVQFIVGPYVVALDAQSPTLAKSPAALTALAKVVAAKL